jgi:probable HAF family extracellular repeat protein
MKKWNQSLSLTGSILFVLGLNSAHAITQYSLTDVGSFGGGAIISYQVNNSGQVVGEADDAGGRTHAFLWSSGGGMIDLGNLGGTYSRAEDIDNFGNIVGRADTLSGQDHSFTYAPGGPMVDQYTNMGGTGGSAIIYTRTDGGKMVGSVGGTGVPKYFNGTSWSTLALPTGGGYTAARGVNDAGQSVGFHGGAHGVYWASPAAAATDIGTLAGGTFSYLGSIDMAGKATGASSNGAGFTHAITWTLAGGIVDSGTLGGNNSFSYKENQNGDFVGDSQIAGGSSHAFLDQGGSMFDLNGAVDLSGSGWTLISAGGISDNGFITGYGLDPFGNVHAFLLTPAPEPGSMVLLAGGLGLVGLVILRRRWVRV